MNALKKWAMVVAVLCSTSALSADEPKGMYKDYSYQQERMVIDNGEIFLVSSFDIEDHICVYDLSGNKLWDDVFQAKIISWEVFGNTVMVFSKHRAGYKTYITCLDRATGQVIWQRP
jgi:hypothetical protein